MPRREKDTLTSRCWYEVYLKLIGAQNVALEGKAHFYAICAQMMRRILVDAARKRAAARHGGGLAQIHLDDVAHLDLSPDKSHDRNKQLIALNDALDELAQDDPRKARVVELRYFGGLNVFTSMSPAAWCSRSPRRLLHETGVWRGVGCYCESKAERLPARRAGEGGSRFRFQATR